MIELIAVSYGSRQLILLGVGVLILALLVGFAVLLFMKMRIVKDEHSVESLPTLADLGLEDNDHETDSGVEDEEDSAFFEDDDDDDYMEEKFLG